MEATYPIKNRIIIESVEILFTMCLREYASTVCSYITDIAVYVKCGYDWPLPKETPYRDRVEEEVKKLVKEYNYIIVRNKREASKDELKY